MAEEEEETPAVEAEEADPIADVPADEALMEPPVGESSRIDAAPAPAEKRARIQIDPNASIKETSFCLTSLPAIPEEPGEYKPYLYTFRVKPQDQLARFKNLKARTPPYYVLFDHTIAVIWTLFNSNANKQLLGIDQLHWAKYFLEPIHDNQGFHPHGVELALETIRDWLIVAYASMSETVPIYEPPNVGDFIKQDSSAANESSVMNFSFNYSQMITKAPEPKESDKKQGEGCVIDAQIKAELDVLKQIYGLDETADLCAKDTVDDIMVNWKMEQYEAILKAVKTLHHISDLKKTLDSEGEEDKPDLLERLDQVIAEFDQ